MRIQRAKLSALVQRTFATALFLMATGGQVFPQQNFAVDEEVIVQDAGRSGKQEWLFQRVFLPVR